MIQSSASSLAIAQVARQVLISICRCLGVFGIIPTPPGSNRLLSSVSAFRDTSHVTHRQYRSANSCLQFGQIYFDPYGGYLLASIPISSIWRIVASCLSLRLCRRNTSICLMPALVFHKWPVRMLETQINHHSTVILAS